MLAVTGTPFENTFCSTPEQVYPTFFVSFLVSHDTVRGQFQSEKESVPYPFGQLPLLYVFIFFNAAAAITVT
jgi:hypothetical protein